MIARRTAPSAPGLAAPLLLLLALAAAVLAAVLLPPAARAASGDLVKWAPLYVGATTDRDALFSAARGPNGSLYVCGTSDQSSANGRLYVAKYDGHRDMVWQTAYRPPATISASGSFVAVDAAGNAVVAGASWDGAQNDLVVVKLSSSTGAVLWSALRNGTGTYEGAGGLAIARDGSVYVGDAGWGGPQAFVVKYDADADPAHPGKGLELWSHTLAGAGSSPSISEYALALDDAGSVYLAGERSSAAAENDAFVLKLDPAGARRWLRTWDGSAHGVDTAEHLVVKGRVVCVAGNTASRKREADAVVLAYDTGGHLRWARTWDDGARGPDNVADMQMDGAGNTYTAANAWLAGNRQKIFLCKYAPSGRLVWQRGYRGTTGEWGPNAGALAVSKAGDAWVSGYLDRATDVTQFLTVKWAASGARRWSRPWSGPPVMPLGGQAWSCILSGTAIVTLGEAFTPANGSGAELTWRSR
jgi:hypothetical protein